MSITTYAELKSTIGEYVKRSDTGAVIDTFIDLAEADMWQNLEIRDMEARATASITTRYLALPDGFQKMRKLKITSGSNQYDLRQQPPESMNVLNSSGIPTDFTVTSQLEFNKTPSGTLTCEMQYFRSLTALSSSNTSNAVLTRFPAIYLYGSLFHYAQWAQDDDLLTKYGPLFKGAIESANKADKRGRYGPAPQMRTEGSTP